MIRIAFSRTNLPIPLTIRLMTWSPYSHVSILVDDQTVVDSTWALGGVTTYPLWKLKQRVARVDIKEFPNVSEKTIEYALSQVGKPYDWTALFGIPLGRDWQQDDRWFCSELVAWASIQAGTPIIQNIDSWRITPRMIAFNSIQPSILV